MALKLRAIKKDPHVSFGCETLRLDRACRYTTSRERFEPLDFTHPHTCSIQGPLQARYRSCSLRVHGRVEKPETPRHFFFPPGQIPPGPGGLVAPSLGFKPTKLVPATLLNGSTLGLAQNRWVSIAYNALHQGAVVYIARFVPPSFSLASLLHSADFDILWSSSFHGLPFEKSNHSLSAFFKTSHSFQHHPS